MSHAGQQFVPNHLGYIDMAGTSIEALTMAAGYYDGAIWGVSDHVCVTNSGEWPTDGLTLTAAVQVKTGPGGYGDLPAAQLETVPETPLQPGEQDCFDYQIPFEPVPEALYRSAARVTIRNHSGWLPGGPHCPGPEPCPFGPEPKATFELPIKPNDNDGLATGLPAPELTAVPLPTLVRPTPTVTPSATATATNIPPATLTPSPLPSVTPTDMPSATTTEAAAPPSATASPPPRDLPPTKTPAQPQTETPPLPPTNTPLAP